MNVRVILFLLFSSGKIRTPMLAMGSLELSTITATLLPMYLNEFDILYFSHVVLHYLKPMIYLSILLR